MQNYPEAKILAKRLRACLAEKSIDLSHGECLELVARQFGHADWNTMSAALAADGATESETVAFDGASFRQGIPILRIIDVEKAWEFYRGFLGFTVDWEHRYEPGAPLYAQVSRAGLALHLNEHYGDGSPGARVFVPTTGLQTLRDELRAKAYNYARPGIRQLFPGLRVMDVADPFGNVLRFGERSDD